LVATIDTASAIGPDRAPNPLGWSAMSSLLRRGPAVLARRAPRISLPVGRAAATIFAAPASGNTPIAVMISF